MATNLTGLKEAICKSCECKAFNPQFTFGYVAATGVLTLTGATVLDAGDTHQKAIAYVTDDDGKELMASATAANGVMTVNLTTGALNKTKDVNVKIVVITLGGCEGVGSVVFNPLGDRTGSVPAKSWLKRINSAAHA